MTRTGRKPPTTDAIKSKCCECMANYVDGRNDCKIDNCPLYYWMPYRKRDPIFKWLFELVVMKKHRNRRTLNGQTQEEYIDSVCKVPKKRDLSDEERQVIADRFRKNRSA